MDMNQKKTQICVLFMSVSDSGCRIEAPIIHGPLKKHFFWYPHMLQYSFDHKFIDTRRPPIPNAN